LFYEPLNVGPAVEEFAEELGGREIRLNPGAPMAIGHARVGRGLTDGKVVLAR
jgi:hypothetical protein